MNAAFLVLLASGSAVCADSSRLITITENGVAKSCIVVAAEADRNEQFAAQQLRSYIAKITGCSLPLVNEMLPGRSNILVGPTTAKTIIPEFPWQVLGSDGVLIRSVKNNLVLAGGSPRGTLYAAYTFLEDVLGCRWWTPSAAYIPSKKTIRLAPVDIKHVPRFEYREPMWGNIRGDKHWMLRNKLVVCEASGSIAELADRFADPDSHLTSISAVGYGHTFEMFAKWDEFGKHPEFFSEIDGKRLTPPNQTQLCLSNMDMRKEFIKSVRWQLHGRDFKPNGIWISQNDWNNNCQCKNCAAAYKKYGSPSGLLIEFVNEIAEDLEKDYPDTDIWTLAYDWSQSPPKGIAPRRNVVVWLATTGCDRSKPLTAKSNRVFYDRLKAWSKVAPRIYIWDYLTNFQHYLLPHPNLKSIGPNVSVFAANNVKGIRGQGAHDAVGAEFSELKAWVQAKLYWNPGLDAGKLSDEFIKGYYGKAAGYVKKYIDIIQRSADRAGLPLEMGEPPTAAYLPFDTLVKANSLLLDAESAAEANEQKLRVRTLRLGILYAFMCRWEELWYTARDKNAEWPMPQTIDAAYSEFSQICTEAGITKVSEAGVRDWLPSVKQRLGRVMAPPPPGCESLPRNKWADLQDGGFIGGEYVDDREASDGKAVMLPVDGHLVCECFRVPFLTTSGGKRLRLKAAVKSDRQTASGAVFSVGIKQGNDTVIMDSTVVTADKFAGSGYQVFDFGVHNLSGGWIWIWIKAEKTSDTGKVTLDRMWLIDESDK